MTQVKTTIDINELLEKKQYGDIALVAAKLGVSRHNAQRILNRTNSKRHDEAKAALMQIIEVRESFLK